MTATKPLAWGRQPPEGITLAWGARAIYKLCVPSGLLNRGAPREPAIDLLWDRQAWRGPSEARAELSEWVNTKGLPNIKVACVNARLTGDSAEVVSWTDGTRTIEASPNQSHGYLYLVAYENRPETVAEATVREEAELIARSDAYHDHPSNPSSCQAYTEFYDGRSCPCENV